MERPRVLVLGGVDPSGGAGVALDVRVLELHRCHPLVLVTCLTVQNRFGCTAVEPVRLAHLQAALAAVLADGRLHAIKLGLFADPATLTTLAHALAEVAVPTVVDPVLAMTAGGYRASPAVEEAYRAILPVLHPILTPNRPELTRLAAMGAEDLMAAGCTAVVVKDGHGDGADVTDRVCTTQGTTLVRHARAVCGPVHGTGCAFAAAFAGRLAHGQPISAAASAAARWVGDCLSAMGAPVDSRVRPFVPRSLP